MVQIIVKKFGQNTIGLMNFFKESQFIDVIFIKKAERVKNFKVS